MAELPQGTVTLLFTDIEGSTRLLKLLGEGYAAVLEEHRRILRDAASAYDGREVDTQGDSFFFAFGRANAALGAAVAAQRALAEQDWPDGADVRVRMGLHTGEPTVGDERYVGLGVHRAARIGAVAHGGQVLLSSPTRELVENEVDGVAVREVGTYKLKDIDRPERLFQLDIDGLQTDFPPLSAERVAQARPLRRRAILAGALAGVIAAAVAIPIFAFGQGGGGGSVEAAARDSVAFLDRGSGRLVGDPGVGASPTAVSTGSGAIWVANADGHSISRIDPATKSVVETIPVGSSPSGIAIGNGAVWVTNSLDGTVSRIDPQTNTVVQPIDVGNGPVGIAYGSGSIWVANTGDGTITRIDADSGKPLKTLQIPATNLAFRDGTLWASQRGANRVVRIDPETGDQTAIGVGNGPTGIASGAGGVWVANSLDGTVTRIDPETNTQASLVETGDGPSAVAAVNGSVWVTNEFGGTLTRIDPRTNQVAQQFKVGNRPQGVAVAGPDVLVAVRHSGAGHRGGTLTVRMNRGTDSIDTAVAYDSTAWPLLRMTNDGLVAFDQTGGFAGTQLVPDLAVSLPTPTNGGKAYTFRLRPNIRYSNGRPVKASDFRATFERDYKIGQLPVQYYDGIVGAAQCRKDRRRCDLSRGVIANDAARTVTFHLNAPNPDFLYQLALDFAYVLPAGVPQRETGTHGLPATGPYMVARYRPDRLIKLGRNPYFHEWSKAAQPDGYPDDIVVRIGGTPDEAVDEVIRGKADAFSTAQSENPPSAARMDALTTRHASQVHTNPQAATIALFLNTRLPPFDHPDVRRALNYAADRAAAVTALGGPEVAQTTCQILPPHFPGYRPYCPFSAGTSPVWTAPDLAKARALVARSGTRGMKIRYWSWGGLGALGPYAARLLRSLGYRVSLKTIAGTNYFPEAYDSRSRAQIGTYEWITDYPTASGFFNALFTCASYAPASAVNNNASEFCDPRIDRQVGHALAQQVTSAESARTLWERIDQETVNEAPWVPLVNPKVVDVLSKRVGNYQYTPSGLGVLFDQLWVR